MKKVMLICSLVLLSGMVFYSCGPDDKKLEKEISAALISSVPEVSTVVNKGTVTLNGIVESETAKGAAEQMARSVKGVKSVVNNIEVRPPAPVVNPDDELRSAVLGALATGGYQDIHVNVANREVTLTGEVTKTDELKIMQIANEANPARVINQLTIKK